MRKSLALAVFLFALLPQSVSARYIGPRWSAALTAKVDQPMSDQVLTTTLYPGGLRLC